MLFCQNNDTARCHIQYLDKTLNKQVHYFADEGGYYQGGNRALINYLDSIRIPHRDFKQHSVKFTFVVDTDGKLKAFTKAHGTFNAFEKAYIKKMKKCRWIPAQCAHQLIPLLVVWVHHWEFD